MRYLDKVDFVKKSADEGYDPVKGEYVEGEPTIITTYANVTDIGTERSVKVFGDIKQGAKVMRTMPLFVIPDYDYLSFGGKKWRLTTSRNPSERNTFILQEVDE